MKILILSNNPSGYATKRLIVEINKRKDTYEVIDPADLYAYISSTTSGHDRIYMKTEEKSERILSKNYDAVIPRIGGKGFDHSVMILKQLSENMNIFSTANERGMKICSNKFLSAQVLSRNKIRNPKQVLAYQPNDYKELLELADFKSGTNPVIAKLQRGSLGVGVMILNDELAASTSLRSFQTLGASVILQKYIDSGSPANDIRVFVIGPETKEPKIFSYKRYALDSDFRSNYSISGLGEKVKITDEERQMSIDAALAVGMGVCGVDIMRDSKNEDKPYILEINSTPGIKGVEQVTGKNVAGAIIDYVRENYKKNHNNKDNNAQSTNQIQSDQINENKSSEDNNRLPNNTFDFVNELNRVCDEYGID